MGNGCIDSESWKNIMTDFNQQLNIDCDKRQIKNHWSDMKRKYASLMRLMYEETGISLDHATNKITEPDEWWKRKIKENKVCKIFRDKDLSKIWCKYGALFEDPVAIVKRAHAVDERSYVGFGGVES